MPVEVTTIKNTERNVGGLGVVRVTCTTPGVSDLYMYTGLGAATVHAGTLTDLKQILTTALAAVEEVERDG